MDDDKLEKEAKEYFDACFENIEEMVRGLHSKNSDRVERAVQEIQEDALEVCTGKEFNGTRTYMILLCTGGPAARIRGDLDEHGQPESAVFEYQNWFTPWVEVPADRLQEKTMLEYAQQFYFEEE